MRVRLFVYGTLMRGEPGHDLLRSASFLGEAETEPAFRLVDCGWYPALVPNGSMRIRGELYEASARLLHELDEYEEVPAIYRRERIGLATGGQAIAYVMPKPDAAFPLIPSGDWRRRRDLSDP